MASVALAAALGWAPLSARAEQSGVTGRVEKIEERVRDVEARLAKVEAMVNQHSAHGSGQPQPGLQGKPPGGGMGGMMDDEMMGMPDPGSSGQPPNQQPGGGMGSGGGMGGHM